jgi:hypothetical protein
MTDMPRPDPQGPKSYVVTIPGFQLDVDADTPKEARVVTSSYIKKHFRDLKKFLRLQHRMMVYTKEEHEKLVNKAKNDNGTDAKDGV